MTLERGRAPPIVGRKYHVRHDHRPGEFVTFTARCRVADAYPDGTLASEWDNGVILKARDAFYYPFESES